MGQSHKFLGTPPEVCHGKDDFITTVVVFGGDLCGTLRNEIFVTNVILAEIFDKIRKNAPGTIYIF